MVVYVFRSKPNGYSICALNHCSRKVGDATTRAEIMVDNL